MLNKLDESVEKVSSTMIACCILHNICLEVDDPTEIDVISDGNGFPRVPSPRPCYQSVLDLCFLTC